MRQYTVDARHRAGHDDLLKPVACVMAGLVPAIHALAEFRWLLGIARFSALY
jgi:hypothetical protein